jgi:dipeptidyl aminopeptidase/acylaminoacyl peptidase
VVVANKTKDRESVRFSINKNFDLYLLEVASKKQTQLTTNPGPDVSPRWSPDGKQIAYLSSPRNGPHRDVLNLTIIAPGKADKPRIVFDHHDPKLKPQSQNVSNVPKFPSPTFPIQEGVLPGIPGGWEDDSSIWINPDVGVWSEVLLVDIRTGGVVESSKKKREEQRRRVLLYPRTSDVDPLADRLYADVKFVNWTNDGFDLEGILTFPQPHIAEPPFKLIVYPHGGPHGRSNADFAVQLFAAHGYAVFQPNFRGSSGYGKKFLDADRLDLGGGDMRDILTGIDKLVKDGLVDPKRQFVYGISYGGFMTSWLVGHTHQFKAAVAQNAVTDMNMMYGLSDLRSWTTWELGGLPWEQPERYAKHSPLTYANKVKTPTLILHARDDRRCPLPMGKAFHQALLANNVPTQMVIYPNEGHGIRQPRHREDVYRRVLAWFAKYDK